MSTISQPWERQEHESSEAYGMFLAYMNSQRPRNIAKFCKENTLAIHRVRNMARDFSWVLRTEAHDAYMLREVTKQVIAQRTATTLQHLEILARARGVAEGALTALEDEVDRIIAAERPEDRERMMKPLDLANFLDKIIHLERLTYGEATDITASADGQWDYSQLTDEEFAQLRTLWDKCRPRQDDE